MSVKMRLRRMGAKHQPSYRIVIADSRSPRDGRYIDQVGFYNPLTNPATITLNREKAADWLRKGAQPTETVEILLKKFDMNPVDIRKGAPVAAGLASQGPSQATAQQPLEETRDVAPEEAPNLEKAAASDDEPSSEEGA